MWKKLNRIYNRVSYITIAVMLIFFFLFTILTLVVEGANETLNSITFVSLLAILLSFPGLVNTIVNEYNPKKKTIKLSCKCPNCRHLVQMDMKEE